MNATLQEGENSVSKRQLIGGVIAKKLQVIRFHLSISTIRSHDPPCQFVEKYR